MSQTIEVKMTIDDLQQMAKLKQQLSTMDMLKRKWKEVGGAADTAGSQAGRTITNALAAFSGISGLVSGIQKAAEILKNELVEMRRMRADVAGIQGAFAPNISGAIRNVGYQKGSDSVPNLSAEQVKSEVMRISQVTSQDPNRIAKVMGEVFAVGQPETPDEALKFTAATQTAALNYPEIPDEDLQDIATGMGLNMSKFGYSPEEALGQIQRVNQAHIAKTNAQIAKNVMGAGAKAEAFGAKPEEAYAMASYGAKISNDVEGSESANVAWKFARELEERYRTLKDYKEREAHLLSASKEEQEAFLYGGTIQGKKYEKPELGQSGPAIIKSLFESATRRAELEDKKRVIGGSADWRASPQASIANVAKTSEFKVAGIRRRAQAAGVEMGLASPQEGVKGAVEELVTTTIENSGIGATEKIVRSWSRWLTGMDGDLSYAIDELKSVRDSLARTSTTVGGVTIPGRIPSKEELSRAKVVDEQIQYLEELKRTQEDANAAKDQPSVQERIDDMSETIKGDRDMTSSDRSIYNRRIGEIDQYITKTVADPQNARLMAEQTRALRDLVKEQKHGNELMTANNKKLDALTTKPPVKVEVKDTGKKRTQATATNTRLQRQT